MKNLKEEACIFFGAIKCKRKQQTRKTKLEEFVAKEKSLKMTIGFQIMRAQNGEGPRGRNPPLNFKHCSKNAITAEMFFTFTFVVNPKNSI